MNWAGHVARMEDEKLPREDCLKQLNEGKHLEDIEVERNIILKRSQRDGSERFKLKLILLRIWTICWLVNKMTKFHLP
jgi:hypothetical protein